MTLRRPMAPDFAPRSPVLKLRTTPSPRGPGITIMSTVQELSARGRSSLTHCGGCRLSILSGTLPSKLCRNTQQHCSVVSECTQLRWLEKLVEADDKNEFHRTRSTRRLLNVWRRAVRHAFPLQTFLSGTCPSLVPVFVTIVGRGEGNMRFATGRGEGWIRTWICTVNSSKKDLYVWRKCFADVQKVSRATDAAPMIRHRYPSATDGMPRSAVPQTARCSCFH